MPRTKSNIWKFFIKTASGGKCKLCQAEVKTSGNTTNLNKHITRRHGGIPSDKPESESPNQVVVVAGTTTSSTTSSLSVYHKESREPEPSNCDMPLSMESEVSESPMSTNEPSQPQPSPLTSTASLRSESEIQPLIKEAFSRVKSFKGGAKASEITNAIVFMIAKDNLPLSTTEHEGFKYLMKVVAPLYSPPVHKTISNIIDEKYHVLSNLFKESLSNVNHITLTMDVWTETMNTVSFLGVTAHYFINNKLTTMTICADELDERHTSEYLSRRITGICEEWNIPHDKITAVVTDNGKNIVKAVQDTFGKNKHLPCFAHTLYLIASSIINEAERVKEIVGKVKAIVRYFKQSVNLADELRQVQAESDSGKIYKLIQSVPTRWNSEFYMLERFVQLSGLIAPILIKHPSSPPMTDADELQIIKEVLEILGPIEAVSKEISGEQYLTCSKIIPIVNCLRLKLLALSPSEEVNVLKELTLKGIKTRFGAVEQAHLLAFATLLDPRFKKVHFNNAIACSTAIQSIDKECKVKMSESTAYLESQLTSAAVLPPSSTGGFWSFHDVLAQQSHQRTGLVDNARELCMDFKNYLNLPLAPLTSDPLLFWNYSVFASTTLKEIAIKYLTIVGSSVPCERLISQAGNIMTPERNNLAGTRLSKLLFLKSLEINDWHM